MKTFVTMLAVIFALFTTIPDAEARKFGGKRSIGKTQKTAAEQPKQTDAAKANTATAGKTSSKKGLMGGLLGGLLAGGLIAAMMGGAFEGFQFMDFLIMAIIGFVLFKLFRSMSQAKASAQKPAYAANQAQFREQQQPQNPQGSGLGGGFANSADQVPFNLPTGFDLSSFLEGSRGHYKTLQQAWNDNDLEKIQEYVSNELYNELSKERRELETTPQTEVMFLDAELVRADNNAQVAEVSVKFSGRYRDTVEGIEEDIAEVWHLERQLSHADAPWLIVGIEQ
ncbi:Tim44 domain-containing protein [Psychrobium sp. 1_MG-2023]|uniref:Tim44 domain-containing protein n=1 Tax=Psychrobium sp. 1_MG-2023 TaxID=3062624 RepID=UPI000C3450A8|nr:TIM44-like domain-containing protein [Psychrobium sp. 1_MG-2023]MDP2562312.1 TIM44-like domain-containing protein [Psychrobium sp. 1_MG-2023]PKF54694.1 preprotein translocase subunit Tim44 [Alteromonadales bacterium alter-6D02]